MRILSSLHRLIEAVKFHRLLELFSCFWVLAALLIIAMIPTKMYLSMLNNYEPSIAYIDTLVFVVLGVGLVSIGIQAYLQYCESKDGPS